MSVANWHRMGFPCVVADGGMLLTRPLGCFLGVNDRQGTRLLLKLAVLLSLLLFMFGPVHSDPVDVRLRVFDVSPEESLGASRFWCWVVGKF